MAEHNNLGKNGEKAAVEHLLHLGMEILDTNWRFKHLELDIVARDKQTLVVAEVKTRSYSTVQQPADSVNKQKQKWLVEAANAYVQAKGIDLEVRFDIISIIETRNGMKIDHIPDAFYPRM